MFECCQGLWAGRSGFGDGHCRVCVGSRAGDGPDLEGEACESGLCVWLFVYLMKIRECQELQCLGSQSLSSVAFWMDGAAPSESVPDLSASLASRYTDAYATRTVAVNRAIALFRRVILGAVSAFRISPSTGERAQRAESLARD